MPTRIWRSCKGWVKAGRRVAAAACAALVLFLGILTVTPSVHHWLHHQDQADANDGCAVVLFSLGLTEAATAIALVFGSFCFSEEEAPRRPWLALAAPRFVLPPGCGPPA